MHLSGPETRACPAEFQERITRMFGTNQFGDPNFKLAWCQSEFIRMGDLWRGKDGTERPGYRETYQGDGQPCWMILKWYPASHYGSPELFYQRTYDSLTKLYQLGEYPWRGRYEIVQPLRSKEFLGGRLVIDHFPLSHYMIDVILPMILAWQRLTNEEQRAAAQLARQEQEKRENAEVAERMMAELPVWMNPVSYSKQGCRTALLTRKMDAIQKVWDRMSRRGLRPIFNRGFAQGARPRVSGYKN